MAEDTKGGKTLQWGDNSHDIMQTSLQATGLLIRIMKMVQEADRFKYDMRLYGPVLAINFIW